MKLFSSLQARVALAVGLSIMILWLAAAFVTANRLGHEMEKVFDRDLQATAERILPLALHDLRKRRHDDDDDDDREEHVERLRPPLDEAVTYLVRDNRGRVLLRSPGAEDATFPAFIVSTLTRHAKTKSPSPSPNRSITGRKSLARC